LEYHDVTTVVPMCVSEFGTVPVYENGGCFFSWRNLNLRDVSDWFDSILFGPLVRLSLLLKISRRLQGYDNSLAHLSPDYAFLCLEVENQMAAIVELSIQPLDPERNPPPVPLPLVYKQAYSESKGLPPPNGWVCNLLVDQRFRGKGYSKILMTAVEGVAKQWGCTSISLHVDADTVTGRVAQRLYERLGYKPVEVDSHTNLFAWMEPNVLKTGLYMVDGVPLIFLQKKLQG
jgi:GNAT superfamily N-acetyltransferase